MSIDFVIEMPDGKLEEITFDGESLTLKDALSLCKITDDFVYCVNTEVVPITTLIKSGDILLIYSKIKSLNVSEYIRIDKQIKELEKIRESMKPEIINYMKLHNLKNLSKLILVITEKAKLDAMKVYKFLGFKKFMTIAKVTKKDTEKYLNKIDIGKCASDEVSLPEYSLKVNHSYL